MDTEMMNTTANDGPMMQNATKFQHHTLRLVFPALDLLEEGLDAWILPPDGVADREEPELSRFGLSHGDLEYFVRFPTQHGLTHSGGISDGERERIESRPHPRDLSACIDGLGLFAGVSKLQFVSYEGKTPDREMRYRFRLSTTYYTNLGKITEANKDFEMSGAEVDAMIRVRSSADEWVGLMDDLIHRKTDRAFLNYNANLADPEDWDDTNEDWWGVEWDENSLRIPQQLFADRLLKRDVSVEGKHIYLALGDVDVLANEMRWAYVKLPCGHHAWFETDKIRDMSAREAWTAVCSTCNRRVFTEDDDKALGYYHDRLRRYDWMEKLRPWISKCRSVSNNSNLVQISAVALVQSMADALETFMMPESINPRLLCPTTYPESWKLLEAFADTLITHSEMPAMTPQALFKNLEQLAWVLIKGMVGDDTLLRPILPPGFESFVKRWLRRAVHDAVGVQADDEQDGEMMDVLDKMQRSKIDPKAVVEGDLDDIVRQIGGASLGTTSGRDQGAGDGDEKL